MSEQNQTTDNTVNDQHNEAVDYADPESPTLAIRRLASPTTGQTKRQNNDGDGVDTDKQQLDMIPEDEVLKLTWDGTIPNAPEASVYCPSHPIKRRRLDLGELMVKTTSSTKHTIIKKYIKIISGLSVVSDLKILKILLRLKKRKIRNHLPLLTLENIT